MPQTLSPLTIAKAKTTDLCLLPQMANRHGLVAGATGTGKTVTLRVLAERLSAIGVPVFLADVKGDLSGLARPGGDNPKVLERATQLGIEPNFCASPVVFWDVFAERGHPVRATVSEMGPLLLSRLLGLNDVQSGVLTALFKIADDQGLLLLDLKDLRALLDYSGQHAAELRTNYGNISTSTVGAIQRGLLELEEQGGQKFFGEPALSLEDLMRTDLQGKGVISVLAADKLLGSPKLYTTFLLWILSELFERLPEVGDPEKPRLVFFFDEAHLLFCDAPKVLLDKVQQVTRLIRSKGVGIYFVTQSPLDIPETVLGQLGNRVQHALRAFTPKDQKSVKVAAQTFRANPKLDVEKAITELGVGEALISLLDGQGTPQVVERAFIYPPQSQLRPIEDAERQSILAQSPVRGRYETAIDRESAYEKLKSRATASAPEAAPAPAQHTKTAASQAGDLLGAMAKSAARTMGTQLGRQLIRGVLGSLFGGRR